MTDTPVRFSSWRDLPRLARLNLLLLAAAVGAVIVQLWPEWRHNPDLSHGLFMPVIFLILLHEARRGTPRFLPDGLSARAAVATLLLLALGALFAAGLYAASVDWSHPLVSLMLTLALVAFLGAALVIFAGDGMRWIACNWSAVVAIGAWLLCTPIPPGTYSRLTLTLQFWISAGVVRSLHLLGIAAIRHGNIIELAQATVGVEEACSGVRSLLSCVFAGLFFSATLVRRPWARAAIIALSAPLALLMNFVRSLLLTLLSNAGVEIAGRWHDLTGFAVLAVTAVLLGGIALMLEHHGERARQATAVPAHPIRASGQLAALTGALVVATALASFCIANTRPSVRRDLPTPDLNALLPAVAPGWVVSTSQDLFRFRDTLQTDHLAQRTYRRAASDGSLTEIILYVAYWRAGQAPVSLVASHTPDACWPGSGWAPHATRTPRTTLSADNRLLPTAEYRQFTLGDFPQYVWFWHLYDGRPIAYEDPYSPVELLRIAWKYGFRHDGDQLFVRVSSNRTWSEIKHEPLLAEFFHRTRGLGL
ncbi:MAG TPA: exosortase/archaeosortase family protein [Opitutaceae bacterium]|nr:exosortase/archaeosortase family protein [Opitutaceae bacterium]